MPPAGFQLKASRWLGGLFCPVSSMALTRSPQPRLHRGTFALSQISPSKSASPPDFLKYLAGFCPAKRMSQYTAHVYESHFCRMPSAGAPRRVHQLAAMPKATGWKNSKPVTSNMTMPDLIQPRSASVWLPLYPTSSICEVIRPWSSRQMTLKPQPC